MTVHNGSVQFSGFASFSIRTSLRLVNARFEGAGLTSLTLAARQRINTSIAGTGALAAMIHNPATFQFAAVRFAGQASFWALFNRFSQPFSTVTIVRTDVRRMVDEIVVILDRMTEKLVGFSATKGRAAASLRRAVGDLQAKVPLLFRNGLLPSAILNCFTAALSAGITINALDLVLAQLRSEDPSEGGATAVVQTSVLFALSTQCRIISNIVFVSRDDVEAMQKRMKVSFDLAKDIAADEMDSIVYAALTDLGAKLARHLADRALRLPQIVQYELVPLPALALSNRIYADASRYSELIADNKIVHPAFMPRAVRALSA